ncbi:lasso peptide biosynthesis B2 protein [unidentified bacterial endosymbiont]|uniref:lasso peptide biosynthesis B2 protein n=1 Tax=unidentified bacterial endosymbiont TaxID=2355 RepID=UPI00209EAA4E|nr:lasso peptide biosynthesis B2 protein [unidentified bacterial endosymbiont]
MKYRNFIPGIYPARVRGQIIIMNVIDNNFYILSPGESRSLLQCYTGDNNVTFMGRGILTNKFNNHDQYNLFKEKDTLGIGVNFWSLKNMNISFRNQFWILQMIKSLYISHKLIKKGLPYTINYLNENCIKTIKKLDVAQVVQHLNAATLLYPFKTKCLEWSIALTHYIIQFGYQPVLKIGVQNKPFYSHAWIELDGEVIGDISDLNERMVVIYQSKLGAR